MTNYGPPGGAGPEPWRGQRPGDGHGPQGGGSRPGGWGDPNGPYPQRQGNPPPAYGDAPYGPGQPGHAGPDPRPGYGTGGPPGYGTGPGGAPGYGPGPGGAPGYGPGYGTGPAYGESPYRTGDQPYASQPDPGSGPYAYAGAPVPPPERKRSRGPVIAVLAAVLALVIGGAAMLWLLGRDDDPTPTAAPTEPAPAAVETTQPAGGSEPAPSAPAPESSADPRFAKAGQCVRNEGPAGGKPKLAISECGPKTYEVLRRIDGATTGEKDAAAKCAKVEGYTNWYFFDSELDTLDFVLCLKQR